MFTVKAWHFNPVNILCLLGLAIIIMMLAFKSAPNADSTKVALKPMMQHQDLLVQHNIIQNTCPYEYGECPSEGCSNYVSPRDKQLQRINNVYSDYQLEIVNGGREVLIWDGHRLVGTSPFGKGCIIARIILNDNRY